MLRANNEQRVNFFHISEPRLTFGYSQKAFDPRDGLTLFGPFTRTKLVGQLNVGIIGPSRQRNALRLYLDKIHRPVYGTGDVARPFFPGLEAAFGVFVNFESIQEIEVPMEEIDRYLKYVDGHQRVHNLCNIYTDRLVNYQRQEEMPVNVWFVVVPDNIYAYGRPDTRIPASEDNVRERLSEQERRLGQLSFLDEINRLRDAYDFEVNFHNQLKARLLGERIVTQLIRESTISYEDIWKNAKKIERERKFDTAKAWNIATTLYYKAGGLPWKLGEVREKVCYLGLVYKKMKTEEGDKNACCAAQMFLDSGDGMVFRGNIGEWYNPRTGEFHIDKESAASLLNQSLESFRNKSRNNEYPSQVFIHARTYFDDIEWSGFLEASENKTRLVGVRIRENSILKLYRDFVYCVPRGAVLSWSDRKAFLWTKGYIPRVQTQLGLETPNPLEIEITRGEENMRVVCKDILALTKLNYNACIYADGLPVTLRFADSIGEILTAGKDVKSGVLPFKHYV